MTVLGSLLGTGSTRELLVMSNSTLPEVAAIFDYFLGAGFSFLFYVNKRFFCYKWANQFSFFTLHTHVPQYNI